MQKDKIEVLEENLEWLEARYQEAQQVIEDLKKELAKKEYRINHQSSLIKVLTAKSFEEFDTGTMGIEE